MKQPKAHKVNVPDDNAVLDWCWDHLGTPSFIRIDATGRWNYFHNFKNETIDLYFFSEQDYQLFKDSGIATWSWLTN